MSQSITREFLLFDFPQWERYASTIAGFSKDALLPIFIFALLASKLSVNQEPIQILKRLIISQLIIISIPIYFNSIASFGFTVADSIMEGEKKGLIANWVKTKDRAEKVVKKMGKKSDGLTGITSLFNFDANDIIEKLIGFLIFVSILLIKVIFSVVYYGTYSSIGIFAALAVFPVFKNNYAGVFKSVLYLILTPILIALVLTFMNENITFVIDADGFLNSITEMSKFTVLLIVLFGTLKISSLLINGVGIESWASGLGSMLSVGLGYKALSKSFDIAAAPISNSVSGYGQMAKSGAGGLFNAATKNVNYPNNPNFSSKSKDKGTFNNLTESAQKWLTVDSSKTDSNSSGHNETSSSYGGSRNSSKVDNLSVEEGLNSNKHSTNSNSYSNNKKSSLNSTSSNFNNPNARNSSYSQNTSSSLSSYEGPSSSSSTSNNVYNSANRPNVEQKSQKNVKSARVYDAQKEQKTPRKGIFTAKAKEKDRNN